MKPVACDVLTAGEREALRLYIHISDPKQIAAHLGKSHHEIDLRFKEARRKLGLNRTRDAAALLAMEEGNPAYQRAIYQDLVGGGDRRFDLIKPPLKRVGSRKVCPFPRRGDPGTRCPLAHD